ncbi:putative lipid-binding transport protein (Tim44 family) [Brevundimonas alba]|uniref:Putative lipid-binding transport protein (Tim44 family) n=1 Tax=Brevundimonas alba TaxID=74314 RepID=A0A7X5YL87_9CAUL|nr:TIM44-related membrane protein TimA [Brevundimonas alba]NJC40719.1 putative lipid-binding transport protein (Tim44 family) [Brevundimonas alba]
MPVPPVQVQIVIFAVIAAIVLFQLYNVLGKKVGRQPEDDARAQPPAPTAPTETSGSRASVIDAATLASIAGLKARDPNFDPVRFLEGARQAHETIVRAYAAGDRETLKPLLTPVVMDSFEGGIAARETRGETETVEFLHPARADLELATAEENRAIAKVRFLAELRNRVKSADPAAEEQVEERRVAEVWTFERTLGASDPNWLLARTEPAAA